MIVNASGQPLYTGYQRVSQYLLPTDTAMFIQNLIVFIKTIFCPLSTNQTMFQIFCIAKKMEKFVLILTNDPGWNSCVIGFHFKPSSDFIFCHHLSANFHFWDLNNENQC